MNDNELQTIFNLLSNVESHLFYIKDDAKSHGLKKEDVITVHALVNSALIKWNEITGCDNNTNKTNE